MVMVTAPQRKMPAMGFKDILCRSAPALFRPRGNTAPMITPPILTGHTRISRIETTTMARSIMVRTEVEQAKTVTEFIS